MIQLLFFSLFSVNWVNQLCRAKFHNTVRYAYPIHGLESIVKALTASVVRRAGQQVLLDQADGLGSAENLVYDTLKDGVGPWINEIEERVGYVAIVELFGRTESAPLKENYLACLTPSR